SGSSNQYSSMSGISSSSTTECSHAVIVSVDSLSSGDLDKKLCPTANPEPRPGSSEMVLFISLIDVTNLSNYSLSSADCVSLKPAESNPVDIWKNTNRRRSA